MKINVSNKTSFADYLVIGSGTSSRHVMGLVHNLSSELKKQGLMPHVEGKAGGNWVVLDLGQVVVHIFTTETRTYYGLEDMWR